MDSEKAKWAMTLGEDPIIDEEEEEMVEMQLGGMNLDDLVEGQQHQAERQKDGEYGNMVKFTKTLKGNSTQTTKYKHLKGFRSPCCIQGILSFSCC